MATLHEGAAFKRSKIREALQRSVAVQWKDGVIQRMVCFRDFEPTGAELAKEVPSVLGWEQPLHLPRVPTSGLSALGQ